jgi:hypothetical protein
MKNNEPLVISEFRVGKLYKFIGQADMKIKDSESTQIQKNDIVLCVEKTIIRHKQGNYCVCKLLFKDIVGSFKLYNLSRISKVYRLYFGWKEI